MTGICPTCSGATVVEHLGRHHVPVEFCPRCALVVSRIDPADLPKRDTETGELPDPEFFADALDEARQRLAEARSLTNRPAGANVSDGERPVNPDPSLSQP